MADKKFKTGVDLQSTVKISSAPNGQRVLILDASKEIVESVVTSAELAYVSGVTSAVQTQLDAKADLVAGKIPSSQLPAIAITDVFTVADITARDALTIGAGDGEVQEGDVVIVADASADPNITAGAASYIYNGSSYSLLKAGDEVLSINGQTGVVILTADDIDDSATTNKFATAAQLAKVDFITVTQAVDLDTMESDIALNNAARHDALTLNAGDSTQQSASLSGQELTLNQATTSTDGVMSAEDKTKLDGIEANATADQSAAEVPYSNATSGLTATDVQAAIDEVEGRVDTLEAAPSGNTSAGDILETSATLADNQAAAADVTGLAFASATVRSFVAQVSIVRGSTYETYVLTGINKGASFDMAQESVGDDCGITFSITSAGQVQYTSTSTGDTAAVRFRADTTTVA